MNPARIYCSIVTRGLGSVLVVTTLLSTPGRLSAAAAPDESESIEWTPLARTLAAHDVRTAAQAERQKRIDEFSKALGALDSAGTDAKARAVVIRAALRAELEADQAEQDLADLVRRGEDVFKAMPAPVQAYAQLTAGITDADLSDPDSKRVRAFYLNLGRYEAAKSAGSDGKATSDCADMEKAGSEPNLRIPEEPLLRRAGVSLSTGAGAIFVSGGDDATVGTLIARWNIFQDSATARWNFLHPPGARGDHVQYWGRSQEELIHYKYRTYQNTDTDRERMAKDLEHAWWRPTAVGPFIGSAALGEKLTVLDDGEEKQERPYLLGVSIGFGFYDKAGSLVYFDIGKTLSPHRGFSGSETYVGVSADGEVLGSILNWLRGKGGDDE